MDNHSVKTVFTPESNALGARILTRSGALTAIRAGAPLAGAAATGTLLIPEGIEIFACIKACRDLKVSGLLETEATAEHLEIADHGRVNGTVTVDRAEILGSFSGDLVVHDELRLGPQACVTGRIRYGRLAIRSGGEISGDVRPIPNPTRPREAP